MPVQDEITNRLVRLERGLGRVFDQAMDWAEDNFKSEIESIKWDWPRETVRSNGQSVGSPRDIVDTGGIRDSQKRENQSSSVVEFSWTGGEGKAYALEVHDGYTARGGERIPARPFTEDTIFRLDNVVTSLISKEAR
jgi:hypothetical protein